MPTRLTDIRDAVLLAVACATGAVVAPALPMVGLPLCALAIGGLVYRGRIGAAAITVLIAALVAGVFRTVDAVAVGIAGVGILAAAVRLRTSDVYETGLWLTPVFGVAFAGAELAAARLAGMSVAEYLGDAATQASELLGTSGTVGGVSVETLADTMVRFAPSVYLVLGAASAVPVLAALAWAAKRTGADARPVPRLASVDLTPHVLWVLIAAVAAMAAGRIWGGVDGVIWAVGANLLVAVRLALLVQGLAVTAALLGGTGLAGPAVSAGVLVALLVDSATWMVSLAGLLDFWINFRRFDRGTGSQQAEGPSTGH